jgi:hypothetical protein
LHRRIIKQRQIGQIDSPIVFHNQRESHVPVVTVSNSISSGFGDADVGN